MPIFYITETVKQRHTIKAADLAEALKLWQGAAQLDTEELALFLDEIERPPEEGIYYELEGSERWLEHMRITEHDLIEGTKQVAFEGEGFLEEGD